MSEKFCLIQGHNQTVDRIKIDQWTKVFGDNWSHFISAFLTIVLHALN